MTRRGVIVLDGASAFDPAAPSADQYVDALLAALSSRLDTPTDLTTVLRDAISTTSRQLGLTPGDGPSSTVVLLRESGQWLELAVLGDSTALIGLRDGRTERLTDDRMSAVAARLRTGYRDRLRNGSGYDATHKEQLRQIQRAERAARNTDDGYWIAEADAGAADHAIIRRYPRHQVAWCVLATDGAQRGFDHHGLDWASLADATEDELRRRLADLHQWEAEADPDGVHLPRAKRHDDKTVVAWSSR